MTTAQTLLIAAMWVCKPSASRILLSFSKEAENPLFYDITPFQDVGNSKTKFKYFASQLIWVTNLVHGESDLWNR